MRSSPRYRIQFPVAEVEHLDQDETYFYLIESGEKQKIRFHDYEAIYRKPGLYEQLFYDRLKCQSPAKVASVLRSSIEQAGDHLSELRVLDFGAGNGMMAQELSRYGISRCVGVDIIEAAREAAERDRPEVYDDYLVEDFTALTDERRREIAEWSFDCMVTVAALGFGDVPPEAFVEAFNLVQDNGWIAFNIKETFLDRSDRSGFSRLIRGLIQTNYIDLYFLERYRHRFSIEGKPLTYLAIGARKRRSLPAALLDEVRG
ncbi:class I SAM-dependent DNA methyltransferase [Tautonia sociabilis]|uniref:Class I SAM-dependent methyltransferase n=1 Tax=Tautonia sociabilis TaxID=2080755 RepID=A0A432MK18_9BACT|nr:class I SAM-dependent methyltransferase [Tautonia sociabilis]RUL87589.1 class I SAM-dependent methyltransferase [Tautonia sociabilis]